MAARKANDFYVSPPKHANALVTASSQIIKASGGFVWEPCDAGDGALTPLLRRQGHKVVISDIRTGLDFFAFESAPAECVVTNPPFKNIRQFIDHAFAIGVQRMALLCNERLFACKQGRDQFNRHRPSRFINVTFREDYLGLGRSPDRAMAIAVWDSPCADQCVYDVMSEQ